MSVYGAFVIVLGASTTSLGRGTLRLQALISLGLSRALGPSRRLAVVGG